MGDPGERPPVLGFGIATLIALIQVVSGGRLDLSPTAGRIAPPTSRFPGTRSCWPTTSDGRPGGVPRTAPIRSRDRRRMPHHPADNGPAARGTLLRQVADEAESRYLGWLAAWRARRPWGPLLRRMRRSANGATANRHTTVDTSLGSTSTSKSVAGPRQLTASSPGSRRTLRAARGLVPQASDLRVRPSPPGGRIRTLFHRLRGRPIPLN